MKEYEFNVRVSMLKQIKWGWFIMVIMLSIEMGRVEWLRNIGIS
jgi:hypothetical protein